MHYTIIDNIDLEKLKEEVAGVEYDTQICLQGIDEHMDPFLAIGTEGSKNSWERKQNHNYMPIDFVEPLFELPYLNSIMKKHRMFYSRLMLVKPKTCYSYHKDRCKRIHIPLVTNEDAWFVLDKQIFHLPADGSVYLVDTTNMHTVVNTSSENRTHFVGQVWHL